MKLYRIIHTQTGLFSLGGYKPRWGKQGKVWTGKGKIKAHLALVIKNGGTISPDWQVIEYAATPVIAHAAPLFYAN